MNCGGIPTIYRTGQVELAGALRRLVRTLGIPEHGVIVIHHVIVMPDGLEIVPREGVGVEHPAECLRNEAATRILALFLGCDAQRAKYRSTFSRLVPLVLLSAHGNAPVDVPVPVCNTQWDTVVEILFGCVLRRSVHRADQHKLALRVLLIEKRTRTGRVEAELVADRVPALCEMVLRLILDLGREHLVTVRLRDLHILILRDRLAELV